MKYILCFLISIITISVKSQNLLGLTETQVKQKMTEVDALPIGKKYTKEGDGYLEYQYSMSQAKEKNGLLSIKHFFDDNDRCTSTILTFKNNGTNLEEMVSFFKKSEFYIRIEGEFAWINQTERLSSKIVQSEDSNMFAVVFNAFK